MKEEELLCVYSLSLSLFLPPHPFKLSNARRRTVLFTSFFYIHTCFARFKFVRLYETACFLSPRNSCFYKTELLR